MSSFLPLIDGADAELVAALARIGPVVTGPQYTQELPEHCTRYVLLDGDTPTSVDAITHLLDGGADKAIVAGAAAAADVVGAVPAARLLLCLDAAGASAVSERVRAGVSGVVLKTTLGDMDLVASVARFFAGGDVFVLSPPEAPPSPEAIRMLKAAGATLVVPAARLTLGPTSDTQLNIADAFAAPLTSDRADRARRD
jgi:phosphoribosyl-ATP pyrophosphohydrolase/phosphoribosyl-AMP cyclohydrolase/histidinol dehydrogenase